MNRLKRCLTYATLCDLGRYEEVVEVNYRWPNTGINSGSIILFFIPESLFITLKILSIIKFKYLESKILSNRDKGGL